MEQDKDAESSPGHDVELDPDEEARRIILARRARFVAVALMSAGVGTAACGGQTGDGKGTPQPCLEPVLSSGGSNYGGTGGSPQACLGVSSDTGGGVNRFTGGAGGIPQPCLTPLATGGAPQPCLDIAPTDAGVAPQDATADANGQDAATAPSGTGGAMPLPCLSPPPFDSKKGGGV